MNRLGILFDIDHTLVIDNRLERVALLHVLERVLEHGGRALGTLTVETAAADALLEKYRGGECSIQAVVERFVAQVGVAPSPAYAEYFRARALEMVEDFVVAEPDARAMLAELSSRGYVVGVLSNGWNPLQERKVRRAGYTGRVLVSDDVGFRKPDPSAFLAAANAFGIDPARTWYVGDDPHADVAGALGAGMRALWFDSTGAEYPANLPPPTARIGSLAELAGVIHAREPA